MSERGWPPPERIWLLRGLGDEGSHVWCDDPDPAGDGADAPESAEYVRAPAVPPDAPELRARATAAFVEAGAAIEHTRWAHWQSYLHSKCTENPDGSLTIPAGYVQALRKQIETPYAKLSEPEKESDRKEVRSYLPLLDSFAAALGSAGLLARSEGEAVGLLRRCLPHVTFYTADGGLSDYDESSKALRLEIEAFLARSESSGGPDAPSYGEIVEGLRKLNDFVAMKAFDVWLKDGHEKSYELCTLLDEIRALLERLPGAQEPEKT